MTALRIEVTAEDIANGIRRHGCFCPVALAIKRRVGAGIDVDVDGRRISVDHVGHTPPVEALAFVRAFDSGCAVEPFTFELELAP